MLSGWISAEKNDTLNKKFEPPSCQKERLKMSFFEFYFYFGLIFLNAWYSSCMEVTHSKICYIVKTFWKFFVNKFITKSGIKNILPKTDRN